MNLTNIKNMSEKIYDSTWMNLNMFFPEVLAIKKSTSDESSSLPNKVISLTKNAMKTNGETAINTNIESIKEDAANFDSLVGGKWEDVAHLFTSVDGLSFNGIELEKKGGQIVEKQDSNNGKTISLEFLMDSNGSPLRFYTKWKDQFKTEGIDTYSGINTRKETLKVLGAGECLPEGTLVMRYVVATRGANGSVVLNQDIGLLVISGLVPVSVNTFQKVGPGIPGSSNIETLKINCIYSFGFLRLGGSIIWLE